jgi:hypothetical protein
MPQTKSIISGIIVMVVIWQSRSWAAAIISSMIATKV